MEKSSRKWLILFVSVSLILVILATALLFLLVINKFTVEITLGGEPAVTMEYGDAYEDPGASALLRGSLVFREGVELDVDIQGSVPELKVGSYIITYTASLGPWRGTAQRTVTVQDSQAPVITLFTNDAVRTRPGQDYREEGYVAADNCDGDITDRVVVTAGEGVVIYSVTDSSGNTATVIREIRYAAE